MNATTFKCYDLIGTRLSQNDFSLVHTLTRGIIKSLSASDRGINVTHRLNNRTLIYRYNTFGIFVDSVSVGTNPPELLLKATDIHERLFYVANENLVADGSDIKILVHQVSIAGAMGIQYIGPTKIAIRNFEPIDLKPLFEGETDIQEGIGVLVNIDHTFEDGVLTLKFVRGRDPFFGATEIFFPFVARNRAAFLEQEIYFSFQERLESANME